jgi:hypothetical protein
MRSVWFVIGGSIFAILGLVHAVYTLADMARPRRLVPADPAVIAAMSSSGLRLARGGTTMWRAWVGFNFSHSLGIAMFGVACIAVGLSLPSLALPKAALLVPVAIGVTYVLLAIRYWFRNAAIGVAAGTLCLVIGWLLY